MQSYKQNVDYHKQLQKTEKIQLFENNVTKAVLTATYLYTPTFEKKDTRDEEFIFGIHFEDEDIDSMVDMMGIRDAEDIQKMKEKKQQESQHVRDSLLDDLTTFIGLGVDKNERVRVEVKNNGDNTSEKNSTTVNYGLTLNKKKAIKIKALSKNDKRLKDIAYVTDWGSYYLVTFEHTNAKRFSLVFKSEKYGNGTFSFAKVAKYIYTKKGF